ncbi:MAG TPA: YbjN domain-containing protein [Magnetospirillaceae bacterium]|nr:YbjN domain-containing protein [Magnetospirillaceae bacterium]
MHNALRFGGLVCAAAAFFALPAVAQSTPAKPAAPAAAAPAAPAAPAASPTQGLVLPPSNATVIPTYNAMNAETLMVIIKSQGQAQITPDGSDPQGPTLKVQLPNGLNYTVLMDDCDGGQPALCKSLEFRATLPPGSLNFAQINSFNESMRYATAYLSDKGVPQLRMDENLRGGVTADFIAYAVRIFVKLVGDYVVQAK